MKVVGRSILLAVVLLLGVREGFAGPGAEFCDVCTCTSGEIVCVPGEPMEILDEQVVCGVACAEIGSTHGSRERVQEACSEVPLCRNTSAPAAGPLWLGAAALGLLAFGALRIRRIRAHSAA